MSDQKRILIVGTQPFNRMVQSRAFESYFHLHDHDKMAQVFSDSRVPCKGHCSTLFRITDRELLRARFKKIDVGTVFHREDLADEWTQESAKPGYAPKKKTSSVMLARGLLWNKKYYRNEKFLKWLDEYKPEVVFMAFSRDFFIFDLSFFIADRFNIPIIVSIADDFIFDHGFSLSPMTWIYRRKFNKRVKALIQRKPYFMFESDKIKQRYDHEFGVESFVCNIATELEPAQSAQIPTKISSIGYFGNLEYGREEAISVFADALRHVDESVVIKLYSKDVVSLPKSFSKKHPNIELHAQIPYSELITVMKSVDAILIVESTKKKHVRSTRYSLSTKVADSLSLGKAVIAYGGSDCGAMTFLMDQKAAYCLTEESNLEESLRFFLQNPAKAKETINRGLDLVKNEFQVEQTAKTFEQFVQERVTFERNKTR